MMDEETSQQLKLLLKDISKDLLNRQTVAADRKVQKMLRIWPKDTVDDMASENRTAGALRERNRKLDSRAKEIAEKDAEIERLKGEHGEACETIAKMHAAAVGEVTGPKRGVIEDVEDVRQRAEKAEADLAKAVKGIQQRDEKIADLKILLDGERAELAKAD